jgi:prolyl-tRNA synthetase
MVETESGEDNVVLSEDGSYASNLEVAVSFKESVARKDANLMYEEIHTPNIKTIDELAEFLRITDKSRLAKSRVYVISIKSTSVTKDEYVLVFVCGDDEVNESKLQSIFGAGIRPAHPEELNEIAGADAGSIGPISFKKGCQNDCGFKVKRC